MNNDDMYYTLFNLDNYKQDECKYYYQKIMFLMIEYEVEQIFVSTDVQKRLLTELFNNATGRINYLTYDYTKDTVLFLGVVIDIAKILSNDEIGIIHSGRKNVIN